MSMNTERNSYWLKDSTVGLQEKLESDAFHSTSDKQIASYILNHIGEIQSMSVQSLAKQCFVSVSTIVRFSRRLGYNGYKDFKNDLIRQMESGKYITKKVDFKSPFDLNKTRGDQIMNSLSSLYKETVDIIQTFTDSTVLQEIADCIQKSKYIYMYAIGDSMLTCMQFANRIGKLGYHAVVANQFGDQLPISETAKLGEMALFVSYSGDLEGSYASIAKSIYERRIPIYGFTANSSSFIAKYAKKVILIKNMEGGKEERIATFYSQFVFEYLFNVIYSMLYVKQE